MDKGKTAQVGLRIKKSLLKKIEEMSNEEGVDKMDYIKRAIAIFVGDHKNDIAEEAIKDYINLTIDEKILLEYVEFKKIPRDIKEARQSRLKQIVEGKKWQRPT